MKKVDKWTKLKFKTYAHQKVDLPFKNYLPFDNEQASYILEENICKTYTQKTNGIQKTGRTPITW